MRTVIFLGGAYQPVFGILDEKRNVPVRIPLKEPIALVELTEEAWMKVFCDLRDTMEQMQTELDSSAWMERGKANGRSGDPDG